LEHNATPKSGGREYFLDILLSQEACYAVD